MLRKIFVTLLLLSVSSICLAVEDLNELIESGQRPNQYMQKSVSRAVSSDKTEKSGFEGDVIVASKGDAVINPVKYNPFIESDDVEVKTWRDEK
ncbi:MAG: hypothetical protein ACKOX6_09175 [Bdellovibrio sp.]